MYRPEADQQRTRMSYLRVRDSSVFSVCDSGGRAMTRTWVPALAAALLSACASTGDGGWTTLMDGEVGLDNFTRDGDANWRAEGGAIIADKGNGGFLVSKQSFGDYQLRVEFSPDD